ncbi:MAG: hypothetical protein ACOYM3_25035 [Terrimicrobiaceae bacterium]
MNNTQGGILIGAEDDKTQDRHATPGLMNEDLVLDRAIEWFLQKGTNLLYRTRPIAGGAIGGVDAILVSPITRRYTFIDAKGGAASPVKRSNAFTNCLGALIKRIRFESGYSGMEDAGLFTSPKARKDVADSARHRNSNYVLALTPDYEQTVRSALDPSLASLLHIEVLFVFPDSIAEFEWTEG